MNNIFSATKSIVPAGLFVILILIYLPWVTMNNPVLLLSFIAFIVCLMVAVGAKGSSLIIIAIGMCVPVVIGSDESTKVFFASHFNWLIRTLYFCLLAVFFYYVFINRKKCSYQNFPSNALVIISIIVLINALRFGEVNTWAYKLLTVPVAFYIGYRGRETWDELVKVFNIVFIIMMVYAILDLFFQIGPYMPLKETIPVYELALRTGGLFVNSLPLTGLLVCYHTILLIDYYRTGHFRSFFVVLSLFSLFLTGSRTSFVVIALVWILFIVYLNAGLKEKGKIVGIMLLVCIALFAVLWYTLQDYVVLFFDRFTEQSEHRLSGFQTTKNILNSNPFGVGYTGLENAFNKYAASGFIVELATLDNMYLTFLATNGLLFIIPFLFYLFIPLNAFSRSFHNRKYREIVMLFVPYILCGMTFNIEAFLQMNILYFTLAGHMYRIIQNEIQNGLINNNSKLQHA